MRKHRAHGAARRLAKQRAASRRTAAARANNRGRAELAPACLYNRGGTPSRAHTYTYAAVGDRLRRRASTARKEEYAHMLESATMRYTAAALSWRAQSHTYLAIPFRPLAYFSWHSYTESATPFGRRSRSYHGRPALAHRVCCATWYYQTTLYPKGIPLALHCARTSRHRYLALTPHHWPLMKREKHALRVTEPSGR